MPSTITDTPASLGFSHPAEWEPHDATWLAWPHNRTDWPGKLVPVYWVYAEIVRKLSHSEQVRILVQDGGHEARAQRSLDSVGVDPSHVEFWRIPTDRGWTRDYGPIFLRHDGSRPEVAVADFAFNAWAKYPDWQKDNAATRKVAKRLGLQVLTCRIQGRPFVLEGGAIDLNGEGTVVTTEECLLDQEIQARNPGLDRSEVETALCDHLGVRQVIWLGRGIAGDDTHGHVDDLCRFVAPDTVVLCRENDTKDANHRALAENRERLQGVRLAQGATLQVVDLPMPAPLYFQGRRLPASYANFYIANGAVLVPTFNDRNDRVALGILAELCPGREVVGIHAVDLIWGLGAIHCLTHEQPAP